MQQKPRIGELLSQMVPLDGQDVDEILQEQGVTRRRFGEIADVLQERQAAGLRVYPRLAPPPARPAGTGLDDFTVDALFALMAEVLARVPEAPRAMIPRDGVSLSGRIAAFRDVLRRRGRISFRAVMADCQTRLEVVVSFLAVLELLKAGECDAR